MLEGTSESKVHAFNLLFNMSVHMNLISEHLPRLEGEALPDAPPSPPASQLAQSAPPAPAPHRRCAPAGTVGLTTLPPPPLRMPHAGDQTQSSFRQSPTTCTTSCARCCCGWCTAASRTARHGKRRSSALSRLSRTLGTSTRRGKLALCASRRGWAGQCGGTRRLGDPSSPRADRRA